MREESQRQAASRKDNKLVHTILPLLEALTPYFAPPHFRGMLTMSVIQHITSGSLVISIFLHAVKFKSRICWFSFSFIH